MIYSLDMVRLRVAISKINLDKMFQRFVGDERYKISKPKLNSFQDYGWKHFVSCKYGNGGVLKMGFYLNGAPADRKDDGFIEFNPNKFAGFTEFWLDYNELLEYFRFPEIARYDLAIDIPLERDKVVLQKDNRMYSCYRKSAIDFTENLGQRSQVGRVKLYNKQLESGLDYPLTRLEITGDLENLNIPKVYNMTAIPHSDKLLIQAILRNDNVTLALSDLPLYHRAKVVELLKQNELCFSQKCINEVLGYAKKLAKYRE